jgi:hypothetical protein
MYQATKLYDVVGSVYAANGFKVFDDYGNLMPINEQTKFLTYHQCDY